MRSRVVVALCLMGCGDPRECPAEGSVSVHGDDLSELVASEGKLVFAFSSELEEADPLDVRVFVPEGSELFDQALEVDAAGEVEIEVEVEPGPLVVEATAWRGACIPVSDSKQFTVLDLDTPCAIALDSMPATEPGLPGLQVLRIEHDEDPSSPGVQVALSLSSAPDWKLALTGRAPGAAEVEILLERTVPSDGISRVVADLGSGTLVLGLSCSSPKGAATIRGAELSVYSDALAPVCSIEEPGADTLLGTPLDLDSDPANGTQVALVGQVEGEDVAGQEATWSVDGVVVDEAMVGEQGQVGGELTLRSSGTYEISLEARDVAGNTCISRQEHRYDSTIIGPVTGLSLLDPELACGGTVGGDADLGPAPGVQIGVFVDSPTAEVRAVEITTSGGTRQQFTDPTGAAIVTLELGSNQFVAVGVDTTGARGESAPCSLELVE